MQKTYIILLTAMVLLAACQWHLSNPDEEHTDEPMAIERFDSVEGRYLIDGDAEALRQMRSDYGQQTKVLIEDVLQLGPANAPDISQRMLTFFQDSTLQVIVADVRREFGNIDDIDAQLDQAFTKLAEIMPGMQKPTVYAQIGSLDQSIIVTGTMLGVSLDKYLGSEYPLYIKFGYTPQQRKTMSREYIVPDCVGFFLLSLFPMPGEAGSEADEALRRWHLSKIQCLVNEVMGKRLFTGDTITTLEKYRTDNPSMHAAEFLRNYNEE